MSQYTRRQAFQALLATSAALSAAGFPPPEEGSADRPLSAHRWQVGLGANPAQLLAEAQADPSVQAVLRAWAPHFLCGWLNSFDHRRGDLSYWRLWHQQGLLASWFAAGFGLQVITWEEDDHRPTGAYHISEQYLRDLEELAGYLREANTPGRPTYWTLATEFSFWRLPADTYNAETAGYYDALMRNLLRAREAIKGQLPNAWVAPSWGGWIVTFDDPARGAGRSMIPPFADMLRQMDGIAFQAMRPRAAGEENPELRAPDPGNPAQILQCCQVFSRYHGSLMISHYEPAIKERHPNGGRADTVTHDLLLMMRPAWLRAVSQLGLNKLSVMHYGLYKGDPHHALTAAETFRTML